MKYYRIFLIFTLLFILSLGAVCAQDLNDTSIISSEVTDTPVQDSSSDQTFTDLFNNIKDSEDDVEINNNYTFDSKKDSRFVGGIEIENSEFTINGNYNTIDGAGNATVFRFVNSNITINNLIIRNANMAFRCINSNIITNNITFIDNVAKQGPATVVALDSNFESNSNRYINNYAKYASAIYASNSSVFSTNDLFESNRQINWGFIYGVDDAYLVISNSTFANTTSRYATAVYGTCEMKIRDSKFRNLFANNTAGAIGAKAIENILIERCEFYNVSSQKNGGAIFVDMGDAEASVETQILYSNFTECYSEFGGAVLQLGGKLYVEECNFIRNSAFFDGGAVYSSNSSIIFSNNIFEENVADIMGLGVFSGGAIYADYGIITVSHCEFYRNNGSLADAIYLYDEYYKISYTLFSGNGAAIYSVFDYFESYETINEYGGDTISLNNTVYETCISHPGKQIVLNPTNVTASASDASFDLRDWGLVTPVKNQGFMGACWAFGATGAFESSFLKATNITIDISENNIQNNGLRYSRYGTVGITEGGYVFSALGYLLSWVGPVITEYDTYDELGKISPVIFSDDDYHVYDVIIINSSDHNAIKEALINYGAMTFFINGADGGSLPYYYENTSSLYIDNESMHVNHFVDIVGWDDNYSASNFFITPPGDGAWICKNSWGTDWGDNGFFYISYYDKPSNTDYVVGYIFNNVCNYNNLYQYDIGTMGLYKADAYMNKFISCGDDLIAAVGTYFDEVNQNYTISVYVDEDLIYTQSGKSSRCGFETIKLESYIPIKENQNFSVKIESGIMPLLKESRMHFEKDTSWAFNGGKWEELSQYDTAASIKVYTLPKYESQINVSAANIEFGKNVSIIAFVNEDATGEVVFSVDGKNYTETVFEGKAILNRILPNLNVGLYDVVAYYMGDGYYEGSSSLPASFNVSKTRTDLNIVSKNKMLYVLLGENATGKATVSVDGNGINVTVANGRATVDLHDLSDGKHFVEVIYYGDNNYLNSTNSSSVDIGEINSRISVIIIDRFDVTSVLFDSEGNRISNALISYTLNQLNQSTVVTDDDGQFTVTVINNCVLDMVFEGNENITGCNASITLKNIVPVTLATQIIAQNPFTRTAVDYKAGERGYMFYFTLKDENGKVLPNKKVKIGIDGKIYTVTTDKDGKAGQMINMPSENSYTYALCFLGDEDYKASFAVSRLIVTKKPITITPAKTSYTFTSSAKTKTVTATLKSSNSYIPNGKQVTLTIAGKTFKATIGEKGQISFNIGSITKKGTYNVAIKFAGTVTYNAAASKNIKIVIK